MKNSSYYIAPVGVRTHDLPHTVASNMGKVSHALTHSAYLCKLCLSPVNIFLSLPQNIRNEYYLSSQKLRQDIESEKQSHLEAVSALERERLTVSSLRRELDLERDQLRNSQNKYKAKIEQLRASCDVQKARCEEINK